jgi:tetratricopeptide (TPR) repeat protein
MRTRIPALGLALLALATACAGGRASGALSNRQDPGALAAAYAETGRLEEAAREIEIAVGIHPRDPDLRRQAARLHERRGRLAAASAHLEAALRLDSDDAETWMALGEVESRRGQTDAAYIAFRNAAQLAPRDARAFAALATAAERAGLPADAERARDRWRALDPDSAPPPAKVRTPWP